MRLLHPRRRVLPPPASLRRAPRAPSRRHIAAAVVAGFGIVVSCLSLWMLQIARSIGESSRGPRRARRLLPPRFPRYGSQEFDEICPWAVATPSATNASLSPPTPRSLVPGALHSEGLASWVCAVAQAHIYRRLLAHRDGSFPPRLLLEFEGMNVTEVLRQPEDARNRNGWEVAPPQPKGAYEWCKKDRTCEPINEHAPWDEARKRGLVPLYRHSYTTIKGYEKAQRHMWIREGDCDELSRVLPGFTPETGMACALNSIWAPSPRLADYEPGLFTQLLPELRGDDALVISLYLRTQWADVQETKKSSARQLGHKRPHEWRQKRATTMLGRAEAVWNETGDREVWEQKAEEFLRPFAECAQQLEREYFANYSAFPARDGGFGGGGEKAFSRVVWMVSSDSPLLKEYIRDAFQKDAVLSSNLGPDYKATASVPRRVVFTGSKGKHTKYVSRPSTSAVAEAFVDWYLLGESDAVVADNRYFSFGSTAALRTARPVYYAPSAEPYNGQWTSDPMPSCTRQVLVRDK